MGNKVKKVTPPTLGPAANTGATSTPGAPAPSGGAASGGGMSATAGPISQATGAGAGNYTSGLAGVQVPKMNNVTNADLNNPASIANLVQKYQNDANESNAQRYQQALGVMGKAQDSTNALYGAANQNIAAMGQQSLGRIGEQLNQDLGAQANSAVSRGLSNTTIADTMQYLPKRQANDATLGVNQAVAQMQNSNDLSQANSQTDYGKSIAGLMQSLNQQGPDMSQFASLIKDAFAGNNGQGFPSRSGTIGGNPPPMNKPSGSGGTPTPQGTPGYMNMADPSQNVGVGGGGGGGGNFSQTGGAGSESAGGSGGAGNGEVNYWQGMGGGTLGYNQGADGWGPGYGTANAGDAGGGGNMNSAPKGSGGGEIASAVGSGGSSGGMQLGTPHPSVDGLVMVGANSNGPIWGTPDELGEYMG